MIVMQKLNAGIPGDHTVAPVLKDIMEMAGSVRFLLLDDLTYSLEFFYLALLSLLCYNYFVST